MWSRIETLTVQCYSIATMLLVITSCMHNNINNIIELVLVGMNI